MYSPGAGRHALLMQKLETLTEAVKANSSLIGLMRDDIKAVRESQLLQAKNGNGAVVKKAAPPVGYAVSGAALIEFFQWFTRAGGG